ncbi:MAG: hypothetical protein V7K18_13580 [Nostoc sp.]|uniref:hypothetical protein n=1 Tax=Nostoc sp. TaxID=1180 RepID=UPI002FFA53FA
MRWSLSFAEVRAVTLVRASLGKTRFLHRYRCRRKPALRLLSSSRLSSASPLLSKPY